MSSISTTKLLNTENQQNDECRGRSASLPNLMMESEYSDKGGFLPCEVSVSDLSLEEIVSRLSVLSKDDRFGKMAEQTIGLQSTVFLLGESISKLQEQRKNGKLPPPEDMELYQAWHNRMVSLLKEIHYNISILIHEECTLVPQGAENHAYLCALHKKCLQHMYRENPEGFSHFSTASYQYILSPYFLDTLLPVYCTHFLPDYPNGARLIAGLLHKWSPAITHYCCVYMKKHEYPEGSVSDFKNFFLEGGISESMVQDIEVDDEVLTSPDVEAVAVAADLPKAPDVPALQDDEGLDPLARERPRWRTYLRTMLDMLFR